MTLLLVGLYGIMIGLITEEVHELYFSAINNEIVHVVVITIVSLCFLCTLEQHPYCVKYVVGEIYLSTNELKVVFFMLHILSSHMIKDVVSHLYCILLIII